MSVIYINPRLDARECGQLIDCTPLVRNSAISVKLVVCHCDDTWNTADVILKRVLNIMKKNFPFVCVQSCSYNYNAVFRITFVVSSIRNIEHKLHSIINSLSSFFNCQFYFDY